MEIIENNKYNPKAGKIINLIKSNLGIFFKGLMALITEKIKTTIPKTNIRGAKLGSSVLLEYTNGIIRIVVINKKNSAIGFAFFCKFFFFFLPICQ